MRTRIAAIVALAALLAGCVAPPKVGVVGPVSLPNGQQGLAVRCSGTHHDWSDCMNAAGAACAGAYDVISQNGETVGGMAVASPATNSAVMVHAIHREMIVQCKGTSH
jgi:hypothetical protein